MTEDYTDRNFVAADPVSVETPRADLVRRQDVIQTVGQLVDIYQEQQRAALSTVQHDVQRSGYLSSADQVAERRKTSRMYLLAYAGVSAMTIGGVAYLAMLAGADGALSFAGWLAGTGALTLLLAWIRHGDEFRHSPEGIARHMIDAHWDVAGYEAETRRKSIEWEYAAEHRRQETQALAAADAREMAHLRIQEIEARRRATDAANERRYRIAWESEAASAVSEGLDDLPTPAQPISGIGPVGTACNQVTGCDSWQAALTRWLVTLYEPGNLAANGVIKGQTPWAARSAWIDADKANARRVCCEMKPALVAQSEGGRWRLRIELFETLDMALQILSRRL